MHTLPKVRRSLLDPSSLNFSLFSEPLGTDSLHRMGVSLEQSFHSSHPGLWLSLFCSQTTPVRIAALLDCEVFLWKAIFLRIVSLFFSPSLCVSLSRLWPPFVWAVGGCHGLRPILYPGNTILVTQHLTISCHRAGAAQCLLPLQMQRWRSHRKVA